VQLPLALAVAL
jgi:hypothetical protein